MSFQIIYTKKGLEKLALAETGTPLVLEKFAVGSGELEPSEAQTALQDEKFRTYISNISQGVIDKSNLLLNCVIPSDSGIEESFTINELGLFDVVGDLIAIAKVPSSDYVVNTSGVSSEKVYNITLKVSNTAEVTLNLNTSTLATAGSVAELQAMVAELQRKNDERIGTIFDITAKVPTGSLECIGQTLNQADYPKLFAVIGTMFGGDETTFNLPNTRNRVLRHHDGTTSNVGTTQEDAMQGWQFNFSVVDENNTIGAIGNPNPDGRGYTDLSSSAYVFDNSGVTRSNIHTRIHVGNKIECRTADETRVKALITRRGIWYE